MVTVSTGLPRGDVARGLEECVILYDARFDPFMKGAGRSLTNQRLRRESAWRLLAADSAPIVLGLLQAHLLDAERRLPASILVERLEQDLELLRVRGLELPQTAQSYLAQWLAAGFLERSYQADATEEEYELSTAAMQAVRFVQTLEDDRAVATESRLSVVMQQLVQLAEQTEPDPRLRVEALLRERQRIDDRIEAIQAGNLQILSDEQALERAREIIALSDELANDFRRVRDEFQKLNRHLRERILEDEASRGDVLEALFGGVDLIAESEPGRTFKAFWRLLTDPEQSAAYEAALEQVMARRFSRSLQRDDRRFLLGLTRQLLDRGGEVHDVLQSFARGLKHFVQSREYLEQRRLNRLLKAAQRDALVIKESIGPIEGIGKDLHLTSAALRSLDQFVLHDPSLDEVEGGIPLAGDAEISLESVGELVAHSEIDFRRLHGHVQSLLEERDQISVADLLAVYPAEQGLGSLMGYLAIGARNGVRSELKERVCWLGLDGVERCAIIPCVYFVKGQFVEHA